MRVFPEYNGAMVDWPEVAVMPGAVEALTRLHEKYTLFVATNAAHSSADEVRAALQRVGLGGFFGDIFTSQKLDGFRKPEPAYFQTIERCLGKPAASLVMIGDDYGVDVLGAYRVGWQTLWFNPDCMACPGLTPLHNGEIYHLGDLPEVLEDLSLPGWNTCLSWMLEQTASHNLLQHLQTVAAAYQIAIWLRAAGEKVKPILAHRGGLLHDLAKLSSTSGVPAEENLGERAARLLYLYNQPELAEIARRHLFFQSKTASPDRKPGSKYPSILLINWLKEPRLSAWREGWRLCKGVIRVTKTAFNKQSRRWNICRLKSAATWVCHPQS